MNIKALSVLIFSAGMAVAQVSPNIPEIAKDKGKTSSTGPEFTWTIKEHDFGEIPKDVPVTAVYKFKNSGTKPIIISDVKKTCGCTVPKWPEQPIMPGEEAAIEATYNAANAGSFNKTITVVSNASENYIYLRLKGSVRDATDSNQAK